MAKLPELEYKIQEITDRIRELRTILGISVEEMARRLGLEPEDYQAYEAGEEELNFAFLYTCAQILAVDVTELIEGVAPRLSSYILTRAGEGRVIDQAHGMTYYSLAEKFRGRLSEPLFVHSVFGEAAQLRPIEVIHTRRPGAGHRHPRPSEGPAGQLHRDPRPRRHDLL